MERKCFECGRPITACMGFVVAGDFIAAIAGIILPTQVRERCGICVEKASHCPSAQASA